MPTRRTTRDDVAKLAGVSVAVVSYVVNDGPRPVAASTRSRVLQAIDELDYRPNAAARALRLARTSTLGLLIPDISNAFFSEFAKHVQDSAHEAGYALFLGNTDLDPERETAQIRSLLRHEVDGLIVFGIRDPTALQELVSSDTPIVSMDLQLSHANVPTVTSDDYGAARTAAQHLVDHGHKEVAFIGGPDHLLFSQVRRQAWADVVGPLVTSERLNRLAEHPEFSRDGGYSAAVALLESPASRPSAMLASSDIQAIGVLRASRVLGISVPGDLAIVSIDGTMEAKYSSPSITVVQLSIRLMAEYAVSKVIGQSDDLDVHTILPHRLIVRESCGCKQVHHELDR